MSLKNKLKDLQTAQRDATINIGGLSPSAIQQFREARQKSDLEHLSERDQHYERMRQIYVARGENAAAGVEILRRRHLANDLTAVGFVPKIITHKAMVITFLVEPDRADQVAQSLKAILDSKPDIDLLTYEDDLEIQITKIEKAESAATDDIMPIGEPF